MDPLSLFVLVAYGLIFSFAFSFLCFECGCSFAICIFNSLFKFISHTFSFRLPLVCSLASYFASDGVISAYFLLTCYLFDLFFNVLQCAAYFPFVVLSLSSQVSFQFFIYLLFPFLSFPSTLLRFRAGDLV